MEEFEPPAVVTSPPGAESAARSAPEGGVPWMAGRGAASVDVLRQAGLMHARRGGVLEIGASVRSAGCVPRSHR